LETVSEYKYLGVIFSENTDYIAHSQTLSKAAGRALGGVINKIHSKGIGFKSFEKLFYNCVVPVLDYCSSVWGYKEYQTLDSVQNRAVRYFLGLHRFAPVAAITGDIGWLPSKFRRWINMLRYWNKLMNMDDQRLPKKVFTADYNICQSNWSNDIKQIMISLGLSTYFTEKRPVDLKLANEKILSLFNEQWYTSVQNSPKLRTYKLFKTNFKTEQYIVLNLEKNERSMLAQFRCGILPLRVETGRFIGENVNQRICTFCDQEQIENETHFLVECTKYDNIRQQVFEDLLSDPSYINKNKEDRLTFLVNENARKTAKYIVKAFMFRRSLIYS
jgi:hypothetical protein